MFSWRNKKLIYLDTSLSGAMNNVDPDQAASSGIVVPRLFEEKWSDTVFGLPWCMARGVWHVVRGAWFRIFSRYLVPLTPPTVFVRSF